MTSIETFITITSGFNSAAFSTPFAPSLASPQISNSLRVSSRYRIDCRRASWSSTIKIRIDNADLVLNRLAQTKRTLYRATGVFGLLSVRNRLPAIPFQLTRRVSVHVEEHPRNTRTPVFRSKTVPLSKGGEASRRCEQKTKLYRLRWRHIRAEYVGVGRATRLGPYQCDEATFSRVRADQGRNLASRTQRRIKRPSTQTRDSIGANSRW